MKNIKVSVIIPVYNLEAHIEKCLESVINQTMTEIEIICVNDGSTDNSMPLLEKYSKEDKRIRIITKDNQGQGIARNIGIKESRGEYIAFVDGDDWIEPDMYEKMYNGIITNDSDFHICTFNRIDAQTGNKIKTADNYRNLFDRKIKNDSAVFTWKDIAPDIFKINRITWNKIYKKSFLEKNNIIFSENRYYQDNIFHFSSFFTAEKISMTREPYYNYLQFRPGATSTKKNKAFAMFDVTNEIKHYIDNNGIDEELARRFDEYRIRRILNQYFMLAARFKKSYFKRMKSEFSIIQIKENPFVPLFLKILHTLVLTLPYSIFRIFNIATYIYYNNFKKGSTI